MPTYFLAFALCHCYSKQFPVTSGMNVYYYYYYYYTIRDCARLCPVLSGSQSTGLNQQYAGGLHEGILRCLCGLVVRVSGYRYRGPGFDPFSE